ncbi:Paraplegin [Pseudolycoriella hygida]|uniref:Paraplegin n=1 Tax=Pseudolycoriella hygida TaxID=35572 RepID=A0A9Q0MZ47_9DIPT|nr:Paraplegin [Pseudolycoriella hygida]
MLKLERYKRILNNASRYISNPTDTSFLAAISQLNVNNLKCGRTQRKQLSKEYAAVVNLVRRSYDFPPVVSRGFHTSSVYFKEPPKPNSSDNSQKSSSNDNDKDKKEDEANNKVLSVVTKAVLWIGTIYIFVSMFTTSLPNKNRPETSTRYVSWHEFVHHMLAVGEVRELIIRPDMEIVTILLYDGAVIKGKQYHSTVFHMAVADTTKFETKLRDIEKRLGIRDGVTITYDRHSDVAARIVITLMMAALLFSIFSRMKGMKSPISMDSFTKLGRAKFTLIEPLEGGIGVYFKDVAGLQEAKQEVMEFVDYLKCPEKYQRLGAKVPRGALLLGPPGCGKTLLAKAVATESHVPFLSMNGSEFIEMIGGLGAARVRDLFKEAKQRAPCIIYIDEIDAIGRQRSGVGGGQQFSSGESEQTLNQLLVEMDGMSSKQGVLMLASTNRADVLDNALLRPGRFDRHITIDLPTLSERKEIFEKHLTGITLEKPPSTYSHRLAILTPGFSGADIANVCNESALHAARTNEKSVKAKNLEYAVERLVGGTEKRSHALSTGERRVIAYHESGHALVGWLLPHSDVLQKVTIVPRTSLALGFAQYTPSEQNLYTKEQLEDKICMALGGRAAENITFNRITTGAQNDLEKVTKIAYAQVSKYGMNERIGPMYVPDEAEQNYSGEKPFSKALGNIIDEEARKVISDAYSKTEATLIENRDKLIKLAEALLERETLNYDEVVELIGPPKYESAKRKIDPMEFEDSLKKLST